MGAADFEAEANDPGLAGKGASMHCAPRYSLDLPSSSYQDRRPGAPEPALQENGAVRL